MSETSFLILQKLKQRIPQLNVQSGSVAFDIATAVGKTIDEIKDVTSFLSQLSLPTIKRLFTSRVAFESAKQILRLSDQELTTLLNDFVLMVGLQRGTSPKTATKAQGFVELRLFKDFTTDEQLTIPSGTDFKTLDGRLYLSTTSITITTDSILLYYNAIEDRLIVPIPIEATVPGTVGNVPVGTTFETTQNILHLDTSIPITTTTGITGGFDAESIEEFLDRLLTQDKARAIGSIFGISSFIEDTFSVRDVFVKELNEPLFGEAVNYETVLLGTVLSQFTETFPGTATKLELSRQPAIEIVSISPIVNQQRGTPLQKDVDYRFVTTVFPDTSSAKNFVQILTAQTADEFEVTYIYNDTISKVSDTLSKPTVKLPGGKALVRPAVPILVNFSTSIKVATGNDRSVVVSAAKKEIISFFNRLKLGEIVALSDLIAILEQVEGLDSVVVPVKEFRPTTSSQLIVTEIVPPPDQFLQLNVLEIFAE